MRTLVAAVELVLVVAHREQLSTTLGIANSLPESTDAIELRCHDQYIEQRLTNDPRCRCTSCRVDCEWERGEQFIYPCCGMLCRELLPLGIVHSHRITQQLSPVRTLLLQSLPPCAQGRVLLLRHVDQSEPTHDPVRSQPPRVRGNSFRTAVAPLSRQLPTRPASAQGRTLTQKLISECPR